MHTSFKTVGTHTGDPLKRDSFHRSQVQKRIIFRFVKRGEMQNLMSSHKSARWQLDMNFRSNRQLKEGLGSGHCGGHIRKCSCVDETYAFLLQQEFQQLSLFYRLPLSSCCAGPQNIYAHCTMQAVSWKLDHFSAYKCSGFFESTRLSLLKRKGLLRCTAALWFASHPYPMTQ